MSEDRTRYHELYFGQSAEIFTILSEFELQATRLNFKFDTWTSIESFDEGTMPENRVSRQFILDGTDFQTFQTENAEVLNDIRETALNIAGVGGRGWSLEYLFLSTVAKTIVIISNNPANNEKQSVTKPGTAFDATIQDHLDLITQAVGLAWSYGKNNDTFLNGMTPSNEFAKYIKG